MNPLRIGIDARLSPGHAGGVEMFVSGLARGLTALPDGDEDYAFLVWPGKEDWLRPHLGGRCRLLPSKTRSAEDARFWIQDRIKRFIPWLSAPWQWIRRLLGPGAVFLDRSDGTIEDAGIDVMHFTTQRGFLTDIPSIFHPHDLQYVHLPDYFGSYARMALDVRYAAFCRQARMVAAASSWVRSDLIRHFGLAEDRVRVIPLAPPTTLEVPGTAPDPALLRSRYDLPDAFVFYAAQTWPHKNHAGLLEALAILRDRHGLRAPLACTGRRNWHFREIERVMRARRLENDVRFLDFVPASELAALYRMARVVSVPTRFEAASFPLWEAFAAGTPACCSNVTSLPEQAGDAALLFDPNRPEDMAECIRRLWTDEGLRRTLTERGRARAARFTWDRTARTFRAHYRRIAGRPLTEEDRTLLEATPGI